jgi:hypothetical protein
VALQRERIVSGAGFNPAAAQHVLETFERALEILESDLDRLLAERISN